MSLEDVKGALPVADKKKAPLKELSTVWGELIDSDHVLEEHPCPRLMREGWVSLNGLWDYAIAPSFPDKPDGKILVPFSPEAMLSGVRRQLRPGERLWYERSFERPEGKRILLHFEAVDQSAAVYINGKEAGRHSGGYLPFTFDITSLLIEGENRLRVAVEDPSDTSYHARGKQNLEAGGIYYTAQSGIWQTVWLESVPERYIKEALFETEPDYSVKAEVKGEGLGSVKILLHQPTKEFNGDYSSPVILEKESGSLSFSLSIEDRKLWSPSEPWLYPVEITAGEDRVLSYFAIRKISAERDRKGWQRLMLNGEEIFANGVLDQGYWPDGLYTAPSDEALVHDIKEMRKLGFNMLRKHAKVECRRWYYHTDRLGMLVFQDMVNGGGKYSTLLLTYLPTGLCVPGAIKRREGKGKRAPEFLYRLTGRSDKEGRDEFRRECMETVELLRGYPSIIAWVIFNEGWGQFDTAELTRMVKEADPGRLVDSASGWFERKAGDFKSVHNYFRKLKVPKDIRINILSEYGGYVYAVKDHTASEETYGYHTLESAEEFEKEFLSLMVSQVLPLRKLGLCGAVYTQLSDIEEETNGLLTYDRKVTKLSDSAAAWLREETSR